jgi:hypothetical protein
MSEITLPHSDYNSRPAAPQILTPVEGERLDLLAAKAAEVHAGLALRAQGARDFVAGTLQMAAALAGARTQFPADRDFGAWCEANGFGPSVINAYDRSALIAFGRDPDRARPILEATERKSLKQIYLREWPRSGHVDKPPKQLFPPLKPKTKKAPSANPIDDVACEIHSLCGDGKWRPLSKVATAVRVADTAARQALTCLQTTLDCVEKRKTGTGENAFEYRIAGSDEAQLRRSIVVKDQEIAALKKRISAQDAEIAELKAKLQIAERVIRGEQPKSTDKAKSLVAAE